MCSKMSRNVLKICQRFASKRQMHDPNELPIFHYKPETSSQSVRVFVFGRSDTGALGNVDTKMPTSRSFRFLQRPKRIGFAELNDVKDIECGYGFTVFTNGKHVYGTGINTDCQIGYHERKRNTPLEMLLRPAVIDFPEEFHVKKMSAGRAHLLVLTDKGVIFSLGNNAYGQCGRVIIENEVYTGSSVIHKVPESVFDNEKVIDIKCGQDHSLALTESGRIFVCGWGADGQTSQGNIANLDQFTPIQFADPSDQHTKFTKLGGKADTILALTDKHELFGWGCNEYGQLYENNESENVYKAVRLSSMLSFLDSHPIDVDSGGSFSIILTEKKSVYVWGYGILGLGPENISKKVPTQIPNILFGQNAYRNTQGVKSIVCGVSHIAAVTTDGLLYTWGQNKSGCLGIGHTKDQFFPFRVCIAGLTGKVSCGVDHTVVWSKPFI